MRVLRHLAPGLLALLPLLAQAAPEPTPAAEILPLAHRSLLTSLDSAGDRLVAVGERGHVLLSDDSGQSWRQVPVPTRATLTGVHFPTPLLGWVVGHDNTILHSSDGGLSWQAQHPPGEVDQSFLDVHFLDASRGIAVGAYGLCLVTRNGGISWRRRSIHPDELHLNRISRSPGGRLYVAAEGGILLTSGDDGSSWEEMDSPYEGSWFGVVPLGAQTLLAHGLRGNLYRSLDQGRTWSRLPLSEPTLLASAIRLSAGPIVVGGQNGHFFISQDGGRRFRHWPQPAIKSVTDLHEAPDGSLIAVGLQGVYTLRLPAPTP